MTRNYVISILTTTPKFISTREALLLLLLLLPLKNLTRTQEKKIVEKEGDSCWKDCRLDERITGNCPCRPACLRLICQITALMRSLAAFDCLASTPEKGFLLNF